MGLHDQRSIKGVAESRSGCRQKTSIPGRGEAFEPPQCGAGKASQDDQQALQVLKDFCISVSKGMNHRMQQMGYRALLRFDDLFTASTAVSSFENMPTGFAGPLLCVNGIHGFDGIQKRSCARPLLQRVLV